VPYFVAELVEVVASLKRIEGFLDLDEVQSGIVKKGKAGSSEVALSVKGNFSWGFSAKKKKSEGNDDDENKSEPAAKEEEKSEAEGD